MKNLKLQHIKTISEFHQLRGLPKPEHPFINIIDLDSVIYTSEVIGSSTNLMYDFYSIAIKKG